MVVFVDFDNDAFDEHRLPQGPDSLLHSYIEPGKPSLSRLMVVGSDLPSHPAETSTDDHPSADLTCDTPHSPPEQEQTPNRNAFSAALSCYPIVTEIARRVDLNTLHALSRTCRQFHANLTPCRQQLVKQTLRCENEYIETLSDILSSGAGIPDSVKSVIRLLSKGAVESGRLTSGKVGKCARDMVAECRRCSRVVCRNCTIKPPTTAMFKNRVRRLCTTCCTAPLERHLTSSAVPASASSFTTSAFLRTPCSCDDAVWLCHPCGQMIRNSDTTYRRVWTWRTRYSTYLGGLGTGIGEGCQGVKCGRGEDCLAAQEIELEVECGSDGVSTNFHDLHGSHNHGDEQPGYFRQEIVGIGGVVKQKAKKRITVGACVVEHEDERETGKYLTREEERQQRSWCGWCWRVIPAKSDIHEI